MAEKIDFKRSLKQLYAPPASAFVTVTVPRLQFVKVDGAGDPNTAPTYGSALEWLDAVSYAMKFAARAELGKDYVVPPLEGLWWAEDPTSFMTRDTDQWQWTVMIMVPDFVTREMFDNAVSKAARKLGTAPESLRLEPYDESVALRTLHVGSYEDEGPVLARLRDDVMPAEGVTFNGPHHGPHPEIHLSDPRRIDPARLKTILRQPVKPV